MSEKVYVTNAVLVIVLLLLALFAGLASGSLAFRKTMESLKRTALVTLILLATMTLLAIGKMILLIATYSYREWFVLDNLLLFVTLIVLPSAAIAFFSVPRLLELTHLQPKHREETANRTKRRAASEVALVVPIQAFVVEALIYAAINVFPLGMEYRKLTLLVGMLILASPALLIWRQSIRRRTIHRDDGTALIHKVKRLIIYTMACIVLAFGIIHTMNNVKTLSTTAERNSTIRITMTSTTPSFKE